MGRRPDEEEVAREMNVDMNGYLSILKSCAGLSVVSIEEVSDSIDESRDNVIGSALANHENPEEYAETHELKEMLAGEVGKLPEKERTVLTQYYQEGVNMKHIATALGVSEARVCQLHAQAIGKLRPVMSRYRGDE
jgi:RNA polymerase sigma factor for flagellar operon FliA